MCGHLILQNILSPTSKVCIVLITTIPFKFFQNFRFFFNFIIVISCKIKARLLLISNGIRMLLFLKGELQRQQEKMGQNLPEQALNRIYHVQYLICIGSIMSSMSLDSSVSTALPLTMDMPPLYLRATSHGACVLVSTWFTHKVL